MFFATGISGTCGNRIINANLNNIVAGFADKIAQQRPPIQLEAGNL